MSIMVNIPQLIICLLVICICICLSAMCKMYAQIIKLKFDAECLQKGMKRNDKLSVSLRIAEGDDHQPDNNERNNENDQFDDGETIDTNNLEYVSDKELGDLYLRLKNQWLRDPKERRVSILKDFKTLRKLLRIMECQHEARQTI